MLCNFFGEPSPEKDTQSASNLHTTITTHLGNLSLQVPAGDGGIGGQIGQHQNEDSYRKGRESFENSLCFKLHELEQRSSRIVSKLPNIHSRILKAQGFSRTPIEHPFLSTSSLYANKLKIIRNLEEKIDQLETNINSPFVHHEHMRNIEREINLDFENYYQEIKESNSGQRENDSASSEDSFDSEEDNKLQVGNQEVQTQTSILSAINKHKEQISIAVCVPKIIEIQIPYEVYKPIPVQRSSEGSKSSSPEQGSLPAQSLGNSSCPKSGSSIQNIINRFNQRCYLAQPSPNIYTYRISTVEHPNSDQITEKEEFHLPLNSYEHCGSERARSSGRSRRLKRTDRSNASSDEMEEREDIWNKEQMGLKQEQLSLVREQEPTPSEHNSDHFPIQNDQREKLLIELNTKITTLTSHNLELETQLEEAKTENEHLLTQMRAIENRNVEMEIDYLQEMERLDELREENKQLHDQITAYKEAIIKRQTVHMEVEGRLKQMEKEFTARMEERDTELHELLRTIHQKSEELDELARVNEEIRVLLRKKEAEHDNHIGELQAVVHELRDEVAFYKGKVEEEGINLKLQEASMIRDLLEKKEQEEREKLEALEKTLQNKYRARMSELKTEKERLQAQLECKHNNFIPFDGLSPDVKNSLEQQIQQLLSAYNSELFKKEQEITELRKLSSEYRELSEQSTQEEVRVISSLKSVLIKQKMDRDNISNSLVQFVYVIDRLLRSINVYEYTLRREKEERSRLTAKITSLNLFFNRQMEKAEQRNFKLEEEQQKLKRQAQETARQLKKYTKKLQFYRSKLETAEPQLQHIQELENEYLQLEIKRLVDKYEKAKKYADELEGKFLNDLVQTCQHPCDSHMPSSEPAREEEEFERKMRRILLEMKEQYNKSVLLVSQESGFACTKSKLHNCQLISSVFTITNKPSLANKPPPAKLTTPAIKALLIPLPEIPKSTAATPLPSVTLDQLLLKRICAAGQYREKVALRLVELAMELNKFSKKLFSLKPCQMLVNWAGGAVEVILRREFGNSAEDDESSLIYRAPEVLLGFNQSEASYVWTIGLIIDHIFHEKLFYRKVNDVLSRKDNYYVRNNELSLKPLLQSMLLKSHKERPTLAKAREQLLQLCQL